MGNECVFIHKMAFFNQNEAILTYLIVIRKA